jgi:allantoin racemase
MKLRIIRPLVTPVANAVIEAELAPHASPGVRLEAKALVSGPPCVETQADADRAAPGVVELAREAQSSGYDGCLVYCFADPGVQEARRAVSIPVLGCAEPAILVASTMGKVGILTVLGETEPLIARVVQRLGVAGTIVGIKGVGVPVLEMGDAPRLAAALREGAMEMAGAGADVILLGCTGMAGMACSLEDDLAALGLATRVLEPGPIALRMLELYVYLGVPPRPQSQAWRPGRP